MATWQKLIRSPKVLQRVINLWPPFFGAGIRVDQISSNYRSIRVSLHDRVINRNYVGTHFGGSLFAMTDPFFMLMVLENLGPQYYVWDRAAHIRFENPGSGRLICSMEIDQITIDKIIEGAAHGGKLEFDFLTKVLDSKDKLIAEITKTIYIRLKREFRPKY